MRYSKSDNLKAITADVKSAICILGLEFIHSNPRMQMAKNTYGGRFAVYRIADCVPMREKRPLTSKQQLAGQRLSVLSRQKSSMARIFLFFSKHVSSPESPGNRPHPHYRLISLALTKTQRPSV